MRKAEVVWKDTSPHDYLAVMRKIRDDVGPEHFTAFTDLVNFYHEAGYQPKLQITVALQGSVRVAERMTVQGSSTIGDEAAVASGRSSTFRAPIWRSRRPAGARLTERFLEELKQAVSTEPLIVLLDTVEKMSPDTEKWLWDEMLDAVRAGRLTNIRFVLCGQKPPPADRDWELFITPAGLKPLGRADIAAYIKKRVPEIDTGSLKRSRLDGHRRQQGESVDSGVDGRHLRQDADHRGGGSPYGCRDFQRLLLDARRAAPRAACSSRSWPRRTPMPSDCAPFPIPTTADSFENCCPR